VSCYGFTLHSALYHLTDTEFGGDMLSPVAEETEVVGAVMNRNASGSLDMTGAAAMNAMHTRGSVTASASACKSAASFLRTQ
jgi:hypothetical protein